MPGAGSSLGNAVEFADIGAEMGRKNVAPFLRSWGAGNGREGARQRPLLPASAVIHSRQDFGQVTPPLTAATVSPGSGADVTLPPGSGSEG